VDIVIIVTRLDGSRFAINQDHVERIEETPTTVLRLFNGNSYAVLDTLEEVLEAIVEYRNRAHGALPVPGPARGLQPPKLGIVAPIAQD
jgi:flagellar protein FlbD